MIVEYNFHVYNYWINIYNELPSCVTNNLLCIMDFSFPQQLLFIL
jgi:hypothetical protein